MDKIEDDLGRVVVPFGKPGSPERARCEWPGLIDRLNGAFNACQTRDTALAMAMAHVDFKEAAEVILAASRFGSRRS